MTAPLLHLLPGDRRSADGDVRLVGAPEADGALVCCDVEHAPGLARLLHAGDADLHVVVLDPRALPAGVERRDVYGLGVELALVHGTVPDEAVVDVRAFPPGPGGRWRRPQVGPLP